MNKTYIIAEVGPNHQGSLSLAIKYIRKLAKIGVDAVKFQIGIAEEHYSKNSFKPEYQKNRNNQKKHIIQEANKRLPYQGYFAAVDSTIKELNSLPNGDLNFTTLFNHFGVSSVEAVRSKIIVLLEKILVT